MILWIRKLYKPNKNYAPICHNLKIFSKQVALLKQN